ncbi:methyltransferase domain-containing protein [Candidatus Dependentiae bacterium]|nr:methyltransferase domain-containing protein [Candidatus Dependentiae bacterium]
MRKRFLELVNCPVDTGGFILEEFELDENHIISGKLTCKKCGREFPIINGVPRLLPDKLFYYTHVYHKEFFQNYEIKDGQGSATRKKTVSNATARTLKSFSYQWRKFGKMFDFWKENFIDYTKPLNEDFFKGKLGLDGGCGFGRHIYWASEFGSTMIGLDLSEAVESAYKNTKHKENVLIVQGDIYNPPFEKDSFDFFYSIGVLHHLPDPEGGFDSLLRFIKKGGTAFAWVYGERPGWSDKFSTFLRRFTTKMKNMYLLHFICWLIALFVRVKIHWPYKFFRAIGLKKIAEKFPLRFHADFPFYVVVADTFDRLSVPLVKYYSEEEFREWFTRNKLKDIKILKRLQNNYSYRGLGIK